MIVTSDSELIVCLKTGDILSFDKLFSKYSERLFFFSKKILKNHEDAEEIVQDVFLKIWEHRADIDEARSFKSYIFTLAYHNIITKLRSRNLHTRYAGISLSNSEISNETEAQIIYSDLEKLSNKIIDQMPPKRKQIYLLSRAEGISNLEIAERLNISKNTVENQLTDALKFIRKKLGPETLYALIFSHLFL